MCSLCTPQFVLRPPFSKHIIISPPIIGFWAATAFGSSSCVWCSHAFGHRVSGTWGCGAFSVWCRVFYCCHRVGHRVGCRSELHTHAAHTEMQMASLCALIFFWQALFVHGKPIFSAKQVTKNAKKNSGL